MRADVFVVPADLQQILRPKSAKKMAFASSPS